MQMDSARPMEEGDGKRVPKWPRHASGPARLQLQARPPATRVTRLHPLGSGRPQSGQIRHCQGMFLVVYSSVICQYINLCSHSLAGRKQHVYTLGAA